MINKNTACTHCHCCTSGILVRVLTVRANPSNVNFEGANVYPPGAGRVRAKRSIILGLVLEVSLTIRRPKRNRAHESRLQIEPERVLHLPRPLVDLVLGAGRALAAHRLGLPPAMLVPARRAALPPRLEVVADPVVGVDELAVAHGDERREVRDRRVVVEVGHLVAGEEAEAGSGAVRGAGAGAARVPRVVRRLAAPNHHLHIERAHAILDKTVHDAGRDVGAIVVGAHLLPVAIAVTNRGVEPTCRQDSRGIIPSKIGVLGASWVGVPGGGVQFAVVVCAAYPVPDLLLVKILCTT
mmetsp:Transcript_29278/g.76866  ORF Transcript_29278/g.76866 Transcript_29278/m.76866 type:complete len:297 (-) Transcript_29278:417-1307(-)